MLYTVLLIIEAQSTYLSIHSPTYIRMYLLRINYIWYDVYMLTMHGISSVACFS